MSLRLCLCLHVRRDRVGNAEVSVGAARAQWLEMVTDDPTKIARPRQIYTGARESTYKQIGDREKLTNKPVAETNLIDAANEVSRAPSGSPPRGRSGPRGR
jgi:hypothetical protein